MANKEGKYIARLSNNPYRSAMLKEIETLRNMLLVSGTDVAISTGVIFDLGLAATVAELRRLISTADFLERTKEIKLEKQAAKIIEEYESEINN